jgi:hypothetical protein
VAGVAEELHFGSQRSASSRPAGRADIEIVNNRIALKRKPEPTRILWERLTAIAKGGEVLLDVAARTFSKSEMGELLGSPSVKFLFSYPPKLILCPP